MTEVAVIGAGFVGLAIAHRLAGEGRDVVLIDPADPGSGASYGNAGTVADYAVLPVGTPDVLKNLPSLLFDRNSPLAIRPGALLSLAPWLLQFARQSLPGAARRNSQAIAALLANATPLWSDLATDIGGADLLRKRGCLYAYETSKAFAAAGADRDYRSSFGVEMELLGPDELHQMEPGLPEVAGAAYFPKAIFFADPGQMTARLAAATMAKGVAHLRARVDRLERQTKGVRLTGQGLDLTAARVVLAAGAHSKKLAAMAGDRVPLDTERGYHLEWDMASLPLSRPTCPTTRGFYLCPMSGRLRAAGTVELGGLTAPPSPHRLKRLEVGVRAWFPELPPPDRSWMGFRPSMPDSLPVIGAGRLGPEVIHAYGHGHIGLTLAPITARIVADIIGNRAPEVEIAPYRATRF